MCARLREAQCCIRCIVRPAVFEPGYRVAGPSRQIDDLRPRHCSLIRRGRSCRPRRISALSPNKRPAIRGNLPRSTLRFRPFQPHHGHCTNFNQILHNGCRGRFSVMVRSKALGGALATANIALQQGYVGTEEGAMLLQAFGSRRVTADAKGRTHNGSPGRIATRLRAVEAARFRCRSMPRREFALENLWHKHFLNLHLSANRNG
jgi:hypothetical protein